MDNKEDECEDHGAVGTVVGLRGLFLVIGPVGIGAKHHDGAPERDTEVDKGHHALHDGDQAQATLLPFRDHAVLIIRKT